MGIRLKGQTTGYVEIKAPATAADNTLTLPNGNGSSNQVLTTDGSGGLTFAAPQLSTDTTPQLGGNLDVNGNDIVTTSNGDIDLDPNGSGQVVFKGNATRGSGAVKLNCENNSHGILVKGPPHSAGANYTLTLPNDTGTSGQLLTTNGSGVTSWSTVSASASFEATADGAIANGDPCVILPDGKVQAVSETSQSASAGSEAQFDNTLLLSNDVEYHPVADRVVAVYRDNGDSDKGKAALGTISGDSITWNTTNSTYESASEARFNQVVYDEKNERMVILYNHLLNGGYALVMSISGNTITYGTPLNFHTGDCQELAAVYDPSSGKIVACYRDPSDSSKQKSNVLTVDPVNNQITSGTAVEVPSVKANAQCELVYDPSSQAVVLALKDQNNSNHGTTVVGRVTGTGIKWGSANVFQSISGVEPNTISMTYDESIKRIVIFWRNTSNKACTGFVDGYSMTFGTVFDIDSVDSRDTDVVYDPSVGKCCFVYRDDADSTDHGVFRYGKVRDDGVDLDSEVEFLNDQSSKHQICYVSRHRRVFIIADKQVSGTSSCRGVVVRGAGPFTNLEATNYIGIADAAYSDAATATIQIASAVDDAQSGLRIGQKYFVQRDGSLAVTPDFPEVFAGTAVSATKLIVKG